MLVWPIDSLGWILAMAQEAMTAADRIYEVFDTRPVHRRPARDVLERAARPPAASRASASRYPDQPDEPVLHDVNLEVAPGETRRDRRRHRLAARPR